MHRRDESIASRGSQEVSSCLYTYLRQNQTAATHLVAYSGSCGGQKHQHGVLWMCIIASSEFSYTMVDHKSMLSGNSYLPHDRDFGGIGAARHRRATIFIPEDWYMLVKHHTYTVGHIFNA